MQLEKKKAIPVLLGKIHGDCYGGPFRNFDPTERRLIGVKMAAEINHTHDVSIPTADFCVPHEDDMQVGLRDALSLMAEGNDLYAGCMGGIGRTGLFMGCLSKVLIDYHGGTYRGFSDPVLMVRAIYKGHAIETEEQQEFVRGFDTTDLIEWVHTVNAPPQDAIDLTEPTLLDAWFQFWSKLLSSLGFRCS